MAGRFVGYYGWLVSVIRGIALGSALSVCPAVNLRIPIEAFPQTDRPETSSLDNTPSAPNLFA